MEKMSSKIQVKGFESFGVKPRTKRSIGGTCLAVSRQGLNNRLQSSKRDSALEKNNSADFHVHVLLSGQYVGWLKSVARNAFSDIVSPPSLSRQL